ncbi:MAG: acyltransferase [Hymenobacter sp.]|nr:MAG: acyltransferase [Hymenobacter sp.]
MTQVLSSDQVIAPVAARAGNKYVAGLALLRGIAALSVGIYHFTGAVLPKLHVDVVGAIFSRGYLGVEVFFVISGFVIPYSLLGKGYTPKRFFTYIFKRIVRINPPAYLAMFLVLGLWYLRDYYVAHQVKYTAELSIGQIVNNLLFTVPFTNYKWVIGIFWTLAIEFQFYIFIGLTFNHLFKNNRIFFFVGAFLLLALLQYYIKEYEILKSDENFFRFGSLFAMGGLVLFRKQQWISTFLYLTLLLLFAGICYYQIGFYFAMVGVATSLAIEYVSIENAATQFLGKISYSFYLVHALVGNICEIIFIKFIPIGPVINRVLLQAACLAMAIVGAYLFYLLVERPFMKLASRLRT